MTSAVDQAIAARIAELDEARGYGVQARDTAKMRRWQQDDGDDE